MALFRAGLGLWISFAPARAQAPGVPAGKLLQLSGTLKRVHGYGPPGYGETPETDAHVTFLALALDHAIHISNVSQQEFDCPDAKVLHLFFKDEKVLGATETSLVPWVGKRVAVSGVVQCSDTAGEMTPLYIDATSVTLAH